MTYLLLEDDLNALLADVSDDLGLLLEGEDRQLYGILTITSLLTGSISILDDSAED
jgi:hypothetical protein